MPRRRDSSTNNNTRSLGAAEEEKVVSFLKEQGCRILDRNYSCRMGEIDIVFSDTDDVICFGEVKYRTVTDNGFPQEAVTFSKQRKICRVSDLYRSQFSLDESLSYRYDVIAVSADGVEWIKNAFEYKE